VEGENKYLRLCDIYDISIEMKKLRRRANLMAFTEVARVKELFPNFCPRGPDI